MAILDFDFYKMSTRSSQTRLISFSGYQTISSFKFMYANLKCCSFHYLQMRDCVKVVCHIAGQDARKFVEHLLGSAKRASWGIVESIEAKVRS